MDRTWNPAGLNNERGLARSLASSSEPLRMGHRRVEVVGRLVSLERTGLGRAGCFGQEGPRSLWGHRSKGPGDVDRLLKDLHRIATRNHDARGQAHRIMQALDGAHRLAGRDLTIPEGLHPEDSDPVLHEDRQDLLLEALEVGVHHVQRHLNRVEPEPMLRGRLEHPQMNGGTLVSREADVADRSPVLRLKRRLDCAALGEDPVRILDPDDLMELQEVDDVRLEPSERLLDLPGGRRPRLPVNLGHQEGSLAVALPEGFPHPDLAPPVVVVPGVVEEIDAGVDCGTNDTNALRLRELRLAEVEPAEADRGDSLPRAAERPHGNAGDPVRGRGWHGLPHGGNRSASHVAAPPSATIAWMFPPPGRSKPRGKFLSIRYFPGFPGRRRSDPRPRPSCAA